MIIENALRLNTRDAIRSLAELDAAADVTDKNLGSIGSGFSATRKNVDQDAVGISASIGKVGDTAKKTAKDTDESTTAMSKSWGRMTDDMKKQLGQIGSLIKDLQTQRKAATDTLDRTLLDQKLSAAKAQLRSLAKDEAWGQLKKDADDIGLAFGKAGAAIGGGGSGGGGGGGFGAAMGGGGFLGGVKQVMENVPKMALMVAAATPAIYGLVGGLTALVASLGQAAAGAGALGATGAGILGVGGISTLVESKLAVTQLQKQVKDYNTWAATVRSQGAQSTAAQTAARNYRTASRGSDVSPTQIRQLSGFGDEFKKEIQPGVQSIDALVFHFLDNWKTSGKTITDDMNKNTTSTANALKPALDQLMGPQTMHSIDSLTGAFGKIVGPAVQTGVNLLESFLHLAVTSEPYVVHAFGSMEKWSDGLAKRTSDAQHMNTTVGGLVGQFRSWEGLIKATGSLLKDIFTAGAPTGQGMVEQLTDHMKLWDAWVKTHPAEIHDFFDRAERDVEALTRVFSTLVSLVTQLGATLSPVLQMVGGISGALGPGGLGLLLSAGLGGKLLGGGAGGKLFRPLTYLLNPAAGVGGTAATLARRALGRGGAVAGAEAGQLALPGLEAGGKAAGGLSGLFEGGLGAGLGTAGKIGLGAAGKFLAPLAAGEFLFSMLSNKGNPAERLQGSLSDLTFGAIPKAETAGDRHSRNVNDATNLLGSYRGERGEQNLLNQYARSQATANTVLTPTMVASQALTGGGVSEQAKNRAKTFVNVFRNTANQLLPQMTADFGKKFKFFTEPEMFKQWYSWVGKLPPSMQLQGAKSMIALSKSLESHGQLAKGSTHKLIHEIEEEFPSLTRKLRQVGIDIPKYLTIENKTKKRLQSDIREAVNPFEQLSAFRNVQVTSQNVRGVWTDAMSQLHQLMNSDKGPPGQRKAARLAWEALAKDSADVSSVQVGNFSNLAKASGSIWGDIAKTTGGALSSIGAQVAAAEKSLSGGGTAKAANKAVSFVIPATINAMAGAGSALGGLANFASSFAGGGWVGHEHERGGDNVGIVTGRGEAVLNGPQQWAVNQRMARGGYTRGIGGIFSEYGSMRHGPGVAGGFAGGGFSGGAPARAGTPGDIINYVVLPISNADGVPRSIAENTAANLRHGPTVTGGRSDHQGPPSVAWAADMSNGYDTAAEHKLASDLAKRFGMAWSGAGLVNAIHDGFRFQLIHDTMIGGNHFNHVHFGVRSEGAHIPGGGYIEGAHVGPGGGGGGPAPTVRVPQVRGSGAAPAYAQISIDQMAKAANRGLASHAGGTGGTGFATGPAGPGALVTASDFGGHNDPSAFMHSTASGKIANDSLWGFAELSHPGSLDFSALGHLAMGTKIRVSYGNKSVVVPKVDVGGGGAGIGGTLRAIDLTYAANQALGAPGLELVKWQRAAQGGFAGWYKDGGHFVTNGPTMFGAGEGGQQEEVHIGPVGKSGNRSVIIQKLVVENHRKGDIKKIVLEEFADLERALNSGDASDASDLMS